MSTDAVKQPNPKDLSLLNSPTIRTIAAVVEMEGASSMLKLYLIVMARRLNAQRGDYIVWGGTRKIARQMKCSPAEAHRLKWQANDRGFTVILPITGPGQEDMRKNKSKENKNKSEEDEPNSNRPGVPSSAILIDIAALEYQCGYVEPRDRVARRIKAEADFWRKDIAENRGGTVKRPNHGKFTARDAA